MSFRQNLINARSHIIFLLALAFGLTVVIYLESGLQAKATETPADGFAHSGQIVEQDPMLAFDELTPLPLAPHQQTSPDDLTSARIAWRYFQNNTHPETGLVNSADKYPSTTMWETGSYFAAVISAQLLGVIEAKEAEQRLALALDTLASLQLYGDVLPNKAYNVQTGALVDYANKPTKIGLGWSALDVARLIATLGLVERHHPVLSVKVTAVLNHWDVQRMVKDGQLYGGNIADEKLREDQEGRVGYEQYAAKGMMLFGYDMFKAYDVDDNIMVKMVEGQPIPVDTRMHRNTIPAFVVSEPYLFDGLEFGFDQRSQKFASAIYLAQEARFENTGILTAVSETHLDQAPYFAYASVWGGGADWAVLSFKGDRMDSKRTISTKASFGWNALFQTEYTQKLVAAMVPLADPERGFPEGLYETGGKVKGSFTANTNSVVLSSLAFRAHGPLLHAAP